MDTSPEYDFLFKLLLIGNSGVGKSSLLLRFVDEQFREGYHSTIGVDFKIKTIDMDAKVVKLQIWDTAGQERFHTITKTYYKGAHGIIVVYDITDRDSFTAVSQWMEEIDKNASHSADKILVGNKCDDHKNRTISYEEGKELAEHFGIRFIETSARETRNVAEAFSLMAKEIKERVSHTQVSPRKKSDFYSGRNLRRPLKDPKKKGCAC